MKTFLKILVILLLTGEAVYLTKSGGTINNPFKNSLMAHEPLSSEVISCRFDVISNFSVDGLEIDTPATKIKYSTDKQKEPITLTFANLSSKNPIMKGNASEVPLLVLKSTEDTVILAETSGFGDVFFYTIFPKSKVAVWQKAYNLINNPYALVSMGYCN